MNVQHIVTTRNLESIMQQRDKFRWQTLFLPRQIFRRKNRFFHHLAKTCQPWCQYS